MTETTIPEQKGETTFWSPWVVFFFGVPFAALNWWRMGNKRKALVFVIVALLMGLLDDWMDPIQEFYNPAYSDLNGYILFARLLFGIGFGFIMVLSVSRDIQKFKKNAQVPTPVKWKFILAIYLVLFVFGLLSRYLMYYGPQLNDRCPTSSLQDVIYRYEIKKRTGIDTILLNKDDFGCTSPLWLESTETTIDDKNAQEERLYSLTGKTESGTLIILFQRVYQYNQVITELAFEDLSSGNRDPENVFLLKMPDNISELTYSKSVCRKYETLKECFIYLAHDEIFVTLFITGDNTNEFNNLVTSATETIIDQLLLYHQDSD